MCRFVSDELWNAVVCIQPPSLLAGKVLVPVMHFCACPIHCNVHWRVDMRLWSCWLISALPLKGSIIREVSKSSVLCVLEVLCCQYGHSFYQIDRNELWLTVFRVNTIMSCQECRRAVIRFRYCASCTLQSTFPFWSWWFHFVIVVPFSLWYNANKRKEKIFIQMKCICCYNVYILKIK